MKTTDKPATRGGPLPPPSHNGGPLEPGCEPFDFNADGAIDLSDAAGFQRAFMEFTP